MLLEQFVYEILLEGPVENLEAKGLPKEMAEWFVDFLPETASGHAYWYLMQLKDEMHQFKDLVKKYRKALKKGQEGLAKEIFQSWTNIILQKDEDIALIEKWATESGRNLKKAKYVELVVPDDSDRGRKTEKVDLSLSSALQAAKQYFELKDGEVFMEFGDGWFWLDRQTSSCSIEAEMMGHCGSAKHSTSTLFSLRDPNGLPAVTVEFDTKTGTMYQIKGKQNEKPNEKYMPYILGLLKNSNLGLKSWAAASVEDAAYGSDLLWDDLSSEDQKEIEEIQGNKITTKSSIEDALNFVSNQWEEWYKENIFDYEAPEGEKNKNTDKWKSNSIVSVMADTSSWEAIDGYSCVCRNTCRCLC